MKHLNESFLGVEEGITNAIKKLGLHAMGIDEEAVRHEALDELAMALQCLKTGEDEVREVLQEADITTSDAQAKTADPKARHGGAAGGTAEKQVDPPSPAEPYKTFATLEELTEFVAKMTVTVNGIAYEEACRKGREDMRRHSEKEELKRSLLGPGEIYLERNVIEKIHKALEEMMFEFPTLEGEGLGRSSEALIWAWSQTKTVLSWSEEDKEPDIDTSDNEGASGENLAENSLERTQHAEAQEGGAS